MDVGRDPQVLKLHPDRFFGPGVEVKRIARTLYDSLSDLPIICPHGHVPAELLARNDLFPAPTWMQEIERLREAVSGDITCFADFIGMNDGRIQIPNIGSIKTGI